MKKRTIAIFIAIIAVMGIFSIMYYVNDNETKSKELQRIVKKNKKEINKKLNKFEKKLANQTENKNNTEKQSIEVVDDIIENQNDTTTNSTSKIIRGNITEVVKDRLKAQFAGMSN